MVADAFTFALIFGYLSTYSFVSRIKNRRRVLYKGYLRLEFNSNTREGIKGSFGVGLDE